MGQRAPISLSDGATTPVVHVYSPTQSKDGVINFLDRSNPIYVGQNRLEVTQRLATKQIKTNKLSWKLETPILEQTSPSTSTGIQPAPTVAYTPIAKVEFTFPDRMTLQERKDVLAQVRDLVSEAVVTDQVLNYDLIY